MAVQNKGNKDGGNKASEASKPSIPTRQTVDKIPSKTGRPRNNYDAWKPEIDALRDSLGKAFQYEGVPNAQTVGQGLRREFGINVAIRDFDKDTKVGTLYLEYPSIENPDGSFRVDNDKVNAMKAKYAK